MAIGTTPSGVGEIAAHTDGDEKRHVLSGSRTGCFGTPSLTTPLRDVAGTSMGAALFGCLIMAHNNLSEGVSMRSIIILLAISVVFAGLVPVAAAQAPLAVSPGDASKLAVVESRCPTFSWGEVSTFHLMVLSRHHRRSNGKLILRGDLASAL
jgi:hypothetical protein